MSECDKFCDVSRQFTFCQKPPLPAISRRPGLDPGLGFFLTTGAEGKPSPVSSTGRRRWKRLIARTFWMIRLKIESPEILR
jgi:hypothetical protein